MKYYTGIGSRNTPDNILKLMHQIGVKAAHLGHTLRSGGAVGADLAFEYGCNAGNGAKQIFYANQATPDAMDIAGAFHPAWNRCSEYVKKLHGRNAFQVLGINLDTPSNIFICWTPDGCCSHAARSIHTGGTGTAISIADSAGIKIWNLANPGHLNLWCKWISE